MPRAVIALEMMHPYPWQAESSQRLQSLRKQLPHAILLHGRLGLGKFELAEAFVKLLLCESRNESITQACGVCPSCHWLDLGHHPDVQVLQPGILDETGETGTEQKKSEWINVEQVRTAIEFLHLSAHRKGLRIVLVRPAEALNAAAANALLKTLEEPPEHALLLLVSHQPSRLLPTLLSRCHQMKLELPDTGAAVAWLTGQGVQAAGLCLALAAGSPLLAAALANDDYQDSRRALLTDLSAGKSAPVLAMAERYAKSGVAEFSQLLQWLQQWAQDLLGIKTAGRISYHRDFREPLHSLAERVNLSLLLQWQQRLQQARRSVAHPLNLQMEIEDILLEYAGLF
ncbi:MAG TPA: DNA polymerase III subunit delta' [Burkholderiales bacterium]|nr:DNA polymerase III subunit delta' [Burkholderiales bacterium]